MSLVHTFSVGSVRCHALETGLQRLDGGAMFGVVPKPLWQQRVAPDERNRIPLSMRCLLIEHASGLVLVDSGLGNKEDAKFGDIYGVANAGAAGRTLLEDALGEVGYRPDDVRWLINTHLHFDHAGGNTWIERDSAGAPVGPVRPTFSNATYVVQRDELDFARHTNERTRASYLGPNFEPVAAAGQWQLIHGDADILPGIAARMTPGHVPHHQSILVQDGGETLCFLGDVMPTRHHVPLAWIMGYDLEPLRTLEAKRALAKDALAGRWWLMFEHDADVVMGRLQEGPRGLRLDSPVAAPGAGPA